MIIGGKTCGSLNLIVEFSVTIRRRLVDADWHPSPPYDVIFGVSDRRVAFQRNPVQQPAVPMIVIQRIVQGTTIIPDCDIAELPVQPALKFCSDLMRK